MERSRRDQPASLAKPGERTGTRCPVCDDAVLRQEVFSSNGRAAGTRLVCSRRGCPWQGRDR